MGPILIIVFAVIILLAIVGAFVRRNGRSRSSTSGGDFKAWVDPSGSADHSHHAHHGGDAGGHGGVGGGHGGSHH